LATGLALGLLLGLAATLDATFFATGWPFVTAFLGATLAGAGLACFFTGLAAFALALACELFFFTAVFELVLRGFFTSCLLAVAAYASSTDTSHLQMNCGHRLICVKTHISTFWAHRDPN
jgi:hypothetical protein